MKILLVGEYSRLHNSLKEGLEVIGHQVCIISTGDYFKNYPADIKLIRKFNSGLLKKIKVGLYKFFNIDISSISIKNQFFNHKNRLKNYDVVQLINESPLGILPRHEKQIIRFLKEHNKKLFLLSCGADFINVKYAYDKKLRYSILDPLFNKKSNKKNLYAALKYLTPDFKDLHEFVYKNIEGVIASDLDYHIPLENHSKYLRMIPNPINTVTLEYQKNNRNSKIIIFLGINRSNYLKKGGDFFEKALQIIKEKYPDKVQIEIVENLPYNQYIKVYNKADIVLDQVLSYDQGYNALEAMAKGKVVFTGVEKEVVSHYKLNNTVAINAIPDVNDIVEKLNNLILFPEQIPLISKNARSFIEQEHEYSKIAKQYVTCWKNN